MIRAHYSLAMYADQLYQSAVARFASANDEALREIRFTCLEFDIEGFLFCFDQ